MESLHQGHTNTRFQVTKVTKFCIVVPNFVGLLCGTRFMLPLWYLAPRILRWLPDFWKMCAPLLYITTLDRVPCQALNCTVLLTTKASIPPFIQSTNSFIYQCVLNIYFGIYSVFCEPNVTGSNSGKLVFCFSLFNINTPQLLFLLASQNDFEEHSYHLLVSMATAVSDTATVITV